MGFEMSKNRGKEGTHGDGEAWVIDFKEKYQAEMDGIQCPKGQKEAALLQVQQAGWGRQYRKKHAWQAVVAVLAISCITAGALNRNQVVGLARSLLANFHLIADNQVISLDQIEPVSFKKEAFCNDPQTEVSESVGKDGILYTSYWRNFSSYDELHQLTGMELPRAGLINYRKSTVAVDFGQGYGHLSVSMVYQGMAFGANGMFALDGFHQEEWGYGIQDHIYETYEYAEGKYAYFVDYTTQEGNVDEVYFTQGDIMFQMFIPKSETAREQAKRLLDVFA